MQYYVTVSGMYWCIMHVYISSSDFDSRSVSDFTKDYNNEDSMQLGIGDCILANRLLKSITVIILKNEILCSFSQCGIKK